jgi:hypothetical protein
MNSLQIRPYLKARLNDLDGFSPNEARTIWARLVLKINIEFTKAPFSSGSNGNFKVGMNEVQLSWEGAKIAHWISAAESQRTPSTSRRH